MKRIGLLIGFILVASLSFGLTGVGGVFSYGLDPGTGQANSGGALTVSHPKLPGTVMSLAVSAGNENVSVGITDDWWFYNTNLFGPVDMYLGPGFYFGVSSTKDSVSLDGGARIPVGLRYFPIEPLELFIEIVPTIGVGFEDPVKFPVWGIQGGLGFRLWF